MPSEGDNDDRSTQPPDASAPGYDWSRPSSPPLAVAGLAYFAPLYEYAVLADRKASFFLSAGGLMLTVLGFFLGRIIAVLSGPGWVPWLLGAVLGVVVVLVLTAAVVAYVAYRRVLPAMPPTLVLFRDIAARTADEYARDARALSHAQAFTDMLRYNHVVAAWGAGKFRLVNAALALLRIAIPLWMLALLVLAIAG